MSSLVSKCRQKQVGEWCRVWGAAMGIAEALLSRLVPLLHGACGCGVAGLPGGQQEQLARPTGYNLLTRD